MRQLSLVDQVINQFDQVLRTLSPKTETAKQANPADQASENELDKQERKISAGYMRVNHAGEVCAQALYQGQALTAKLPKVRGEMEKAAAEEVDHLVWCAERLEELGSHRSILDPLWYTLSFSIGATAGLINDKISLGFVAATEEQVCKHLQNHLDKLPENDLKSRAIVTQMLEDEERHASNALAAGGYDFPAPVKSFMTLTSKAMTLSSYHI